LPGLTLPRPGSMGASTGAMTAKGPAARAPVAANASSTLLPPCPAARRGPCNTVGIPDTFLLYEKSAQTLHPARVVWRQGNALGIKFEGPATSIHDDTNKRYARFRF
jgi:hypothetical protein